MQGWREGHGPACGGPVALISDCTLCAQIWPVLAVAGGRCADGGAPGLSLKLTAPAAAEEAGTAGAEAEAEVRLVTVWAGLPLLQRLEAFLGLLAAHQAAAAAAEAARWSPDQIASMLNGKALLAGLRVGCSQKDLLQLTWQCGPQHLCK